MLLLSINNTDQSWSIQPHLCLIAPSVLSSCSLHASEPPGVVCNVRLLTKKLCRTSERSADQRQIILL